MNDTLVMAKKEDFDVFNALSLMDNMEFLQELKFGPGDGDLMYYLYNWRYPRMEGNKIKKDGLLLTTASRGTGGAVKQTRPSPCTDLATRGAFDC
ncbi:Glycylpeptide N-tetradecanoyltransferase 2 [Phytophthora ramorum]